MDYPADWHYAIKADIHDGTTPIQELQIVPSLEQNVINAGNPQYICFSGTAGQAGGPVSISPKPGNIAGTKVVIGLFKKQMTPYTAQTIHSTPLPFDDLWFSVFEDGIRAEAYLYSDDARAGGVQVSAADGRQVFSGHRAAFEAGLLQMLEKEPLPTVSFAPPTKESKR
jgi:hypothetical protein